MAQPTAHGIMFLGAIMATKHDEISALTLVSQFPGATIFVLKEDSKRTDRITITIKGGAALSEIVR